MRFGVRDKFVERGKHAGVLGAAHAVQLLDELAMRVVHDVVPERELLRPREYGLVHGISLRYEGAG